jgi:TolB-like protein
MSSFGARINEMIEPTAPAPEESNAASLAVGSHPHPAAPAGVWERLKQHKVAEWTLAYAAAAYTLLHVVEMVSEAMDWPHVIARLLTLVLALGVPLVITLAWYHGAKGLKRFSAAELTIITILLVIAGTALWALNRTGSKESHDNQAEIPKVPAAAESASLPESVVAAAPDRPPANSVAVMPFTNLTGDPTKEYVGDGLSEEIINELAQVVGLKVPARTSSFAYKGRNPDARQIGRDLGVANILQGSVRTEGKRIRVTAQLINAQDGLNVWVKTYEEDLTGIFKLQEELARSIAAVLKVNLAETGSPAGMLTHNLEAYQLYLQAGAAGASASVAGLAAATELARQAVAKDPSFARAHALLAGFRLANLASPGPVLTDALAEARHETTLALKLEPRQPTALNVLGQIETLEGHWVDAEKYYREALSVDPSDARNHFTYANFQLPAVGHLRQAIEEGRNAYRLAPALPVMSVLLGRSLAGAGQEAESVKYADQAVRLGLSDTTFLQQIYLGRDVRHGDLQDTAHQAALGFPVAMQTAGLEEALRDILRAFRDPSQRSGASKRLLKVVAATDESRLDLVTSSRVVVWYARAGDLDAAYAQADKTLDRLVRSGYPGYGSLSGIFWIQDTSAFRQDPRFGKFVSRLGMMSYWKQYGPPDDCDLKDDKLTCH